MIFDFKNYTKAEMNQALKEAVEWLKSEEGKAAYEEIKSKTPKWTKDPRLACALLIGRYSEIPLDKINFQELVEKYSKNVYVPVETGAARLGLNLSMMRKILQRGEIQGAYKEGVKWVIPSVELNYYAANRVIRTGPAAKRCQLGCRI